MTDTRYRRPRRPTWQAQRRAARAIRSAQKFAALAWNDAAPS